MKCQMQVYEMPDLLDTHLDLLDTNNFRKHFVCHQDVLQTSLRHVFKTGPQDVFKTCLQDVFKKCLQDVFNMSSA